MGPDNQEGEAAGRDAAHFALDKRLKRDFKALTEEILCQFNPRSTAIDAHIQHGPSRKTANRVSWATA